MFSPRIALGLTRALVGLGSWLAPDLTARVFGIGTTSASRFVTRLFGARELALAVALLAGPPAARRPVAVLGATVDAVDAIAGFDERRRSNLSVRATVLGPVGAVMFSALGVMAAREASKVSPP